MNLRPLVDCDILVYRCGFATRDDEPVENALHNAKVFIEGTLDKFQGKPAKLYLTGKDNFRDKIAVTKPYKGNRMDQVKPKYYKEIREYLINVHGAEVINGMEADDALGIEQWAHPDKSTVIVTTDKDLNMIPGFHYNWIKDDLFYVTKHEAIVFFYRQMLIGDRVDNIEGVAGIGPVKAAKLIPLEGMGEREMEEAVMAEYYKAYGEDVGYDRFCESQNLLWILRSPKELEYCV